MGFNKVQEKHWHNFQLTILVHISYQWNLAYLEEPNSNAKKLIVQYHYYFYDDIGHYTLFVQHYFELHWSKLINCSFYYNKHLV
jgi:hypothetical protein